MERGNVKNRKLEIQLAIVDLEGSTARLSAALEADKPGDLEEQLRDIETDAWWVARLLRKYGRTAALVAVVLVLVACSHGGATITALCGDDASVDATPDVAIDIQDASLWNPTPSSSFPDTTGQGHPMVTLLFPTTYSNSPEIARPLLMFLDGYNGTGATSISRFKMAGYENEGNGALVLAPTGIIGSEGKRRWNASPQCCEPVQPANDDVAYLGGLIDAVIAAGWHVDPARIFVLGMSNGAVMAARLICERADILDGAIMISGFGVAPSLTCSPSRHVHVLHAHTRTDDTFFYAGGTATFTNPDMPSPYPSFEGASGTIAQSIAANACSGGFPSPFPTLRTLNLDDHPGYPTMQADTIVAEIDGCPTDGTITIWQGPYLAPTWNHSLLSSPELGGYIRSWLAAHGRP